MSDKESIKSFCLDGEKTVYLVLSKLKFLSKIKPNEKINVKNMTLVEHDRFQVNLYRFVYGESRQTTLDFINSVLSEAIDICSSYLFREEKFYRQIGGMLLEGVEECRQGITNLTTTYTDDRMFVSKLDTLMKTLNIKMDELKHNLAVENFNNDKNPGTVVL